ncbi:tetratricopeptide repeat protein [Pontibacter virosus]|nr:tetratricopeptide repeat protein [Pontibacter virosus]
MKANLLLLIIFIILAFRVDAQRKHENIFFCGYTTNTNADALCNYFQSSAILPNKSAENAVDKILAPLGLPRNFVLVSCPKINNAIAITPSDGIRYIVYDNEFMKQIDQSTTNWSSTSILAHEIGHHLSGHTLIGSKDLHDHRIKELEADEFSGFILFKMGATLEQAQAAINKASTDHDDTYSTHPNRKKRLDAIAKGYQKAKSQQKINGIDDGPTFENYLSLGIKAMDNQAYEIAIVNFNNAIAFNPKNSIAFERRAIVKSLMRDEPGALADYTKAIELDPTNVSSYTNRGISKARLSDDKGALNDYTKALQIDPYYDFAYYNLGIYYARKGYENEGDNKISNDYYSKALNNLNKSIELNSNNQYAFVTRGKLKAKAYSDHFSAIKDFDSALSIDSKCYEAYYERGNSKYSTNNFSDAIPDYDKFLKSDPYHAYAYYFRGLSREKLNDYPGLISDFKKAIENEIDNAGAYYMVGWSYASEGDQTRDNEKVSKDKFNKALEYLNKCLELDSKYTIAYYYRGMVKADAKNDSKGALEDFNVFLTSVKDSPDAYFRRGLCKVDLSDFKGAVKDFDKAIELDPSMPNYYYNRGTVKQFDLMDNSGALQDYNKIIETGQGDFAIYYLRGRVKAELGDIKGGLSDLDYSIKLNSESSESYFTKGMILGQQGNSTKACEQLKKAAELGHEDALIKIKELCN